MPYPQPNSIRSLALTNSENLVQIDQTAQFVDAEHEILYSQTFGGGGLGLGLLLGPLGGLANASMVESKTMSEASSLKGKIQISPTEIFQNEAKKLGLSVSEGPSDSDLRVKPYLRISKTTETAVHLTASLVVEKGVGANKWTGRYFYQLPGDYTILKLTQLESSGVDAIRSSTQAAYRNLLTFISRESASSAQTEKKILFKSPYLTPRFEFEQAGSLVSEEQDVIWIRAFQGVYAVQKTQVSYSARN